ncbi:RnfH family protein [Janthinobacterium sp. BJB1]|uniref:RnfH family protein n=1 Tax=Janthinobacterium sp. GW458P TaxID=1981504 RepID=UPI000A320D9B|nr:RnfH family protein [Janthinobacterium sp. GW458P]MBE3024296.1 RnfH family protein [Janthinobacterium sp. GW458P]PHV13833.1 RnfH family protein [Janthinobacterium sp. BJB303]PJC95581.1 RnfH family protein [Janthinobacterium sp. BJB1]
MAEADIQVQVCHALPDSSFLRSLTVPAGTTIGQAVERSGLLQEMPGIDLAANVVGIYGKRKPLDTVLREHDRVEVYRPLQADPKEARRRRAGNKPA